MTSSISSAIAEHRADHAVDALVVTPHEQLERRAIMGPRAVHEIFVGVFEVRGFDSRPRSTRHVE